MELIYEILTSFVIGVSVCYFFYNAVVLLRFHPYRLQRVLAYIFLYWVVATGKDLLVVIPGHYTDHYLGMIFLADGWSAITFAVLIFELPSPGWVRWWKVVLMSVPFASFTLYYLIIGGDEVLMFYACFLGVFGVVMLTTGCLRVYRYLRYIRSEYSNIDNIDLSRFWSIIALFFFTQLLWLFISLLPSLKLDIMYYLMTLLCWHLTLYNCRKLRPVLIPRGVAGERFSESAAVADNTGGFRNGLERLMNDERLYLEKDLRLEYVARRLKTNRTYLSRYFHDSLDTTFYDYINTRRVKEAAIPLMKSHPEYKLEHIASESGFSSISTFRRAFKRVTGVLPMDYGRRLTEEK